MHKTPGRSGHKLYSVCMAVATPRKRLSVNELAEWSIDLTPEQKGRIRSVSEGDHGELFIEFRGDLGAWAAIDVVVALAASRPDEISCEALNLIRLWWD